METRSSRQLITMYLTLNATINGVLKILNVIDKECVEIIVVALKINYLRIRFVVLTSTGDEHYQYQS